MSLGLIFSGTTHSVDFGGSSLVARARVCTFQAGMARFVSTRVTVMRVGWVTMQRGRVGCLFKFTNSFCEKSDLF